jgi:hypothetical protein
VGLDLASVTPTDVGLDLASVTPPVRADAVLVRVAVGTDTDVVLVNTGELESAVLRYR